MILLGAAGFIIWLRADILGVSAAYALVGLSLAVWVPSRNRAISLPALQPSWTWRSTDQHGVQLLSPG
ncbi:hypothetical protein [Pyrodictium occultum]|uniref:hypothetical protein n=1 Tax=Pyrodictium occultum TaxID=2309 RepID=UPI001443328B|nr:hypothetical protein [Pyrodictium occultum]